jgi:hypothetical protein
MSQLIEITPVEEEDPLARYRATLSSRLKKRLGLRRPKIAEMLVVAALLPLLYFAATGVRLYLDRKDLVGVLQSLNSPLPAFPEAEIAPHERNAWWSVAIDDIKYGPPRFSLRWETALVLGIGRIPNIRPEEICDFYHQEINARGFRFKKMDSHDFFTSWDPAIFLWHNEPMKLVGGGKQRGKSRAYRSPDGMLSIRCLIQDLGADGRPVPIADPNQRSTDRYDAYDVGGRRTAVVLIRLFETDYTDYPDQAIDIERTGGASSSYIPAPDRRDAPPRSTGGL